MYAYINCKNRSSWGKAGAEKGLRPGSAGFEVGLRAERLNRGLL